VNRTTFFVTVGVIASWGVSGALGGCGGDEAVPTETAGASGGSSDASGSTDGGNEEAAGEQLQPSPKKIACGALECDVGVERTGQPDIPGSLCCLQDGGASQVCMPIDGTPRCESFGLRCDDQSDCAENEKCCVRGNRTECRKDCSDVSGAAIQVCRTSAECGNTGPCVERTCHALKLRVCGAPEPCR
jgi:hypothetical protein